jgi:hypothetical protein
VSSDLGLTYSSRKSGGQHFGIDGISLVFTQETKYRGKEMWFVKRVMGIWSVDSRGNVNDELQKKSKSEYIR